MNPLFVSAFALGFAGSLHCVAMCGPIVLAMNRSAQPKQNAVLERLCYHLGRTGTYVVLGALVGGAGQLIAIAGWQQGLSITAGVILALSLILPRIAPSVTARLRAGGIIAGIMSAVHLSWRNLLTARTYRAALAVGLLNGFLPCGLLGVALATAAATGSWSAGAGSMLLFGLGTIPALVVVSVAGTLVPASFRRSVGKLVPVGTIIMAALLILRGLSLGIPYLSPQLHPSSHDSARSISDCCK